MMNRIRCFQLVRTNSFRRSLRRLAFGPDCPAAPNKWGGRCHDAEVVLDVVVVDASTPDGTHGIRTTPIGDCMIDELEGLPFTCAREDERWPKRCERCGYEFSESDQWQANATRLYAQPDGSLLTPHEAGPGAMWFAPWYDQIFEPQLEHCLMVMLPGGTDWCVDSQANNCPMKDDHRQEKHHCWVISGTMPDITAGKNGPTCSAGAGSIAAPGYHGFLRNGYLEEC